MRLVYMSKLQNKKDLEALINRKVEIANVWMKANKLKITTLKLSVLVIAPGAKTASQQPTILCNGRLIAVSSTVKKLGLWIDKALCYLSIVCCVVLNQHDHD